MYHKRWSWRAKYPFGWMPPALRFIVPYWTRVILVLAAGVAATGFGLLQPHISKLLIDDALLKRNLHAAGGERLMFSITVLGFVLNIFCSFQHLC